MAALTEHCSAADWVDCWESWLAASWDYAKAAMKAVCLVWRLAEMLAVDLAA